MHDTAAAFGAAFFRCYADGLDGARILEVGAGDVNGTLRGCAPGGSRYTGVDLAPGPGVDVVLTDPYRYPFGADSYDFIVSTSCLEHDPMFWLTFAEMCRVLKAGGFIYLNVPSNGWFHRFPTDNWRLYPDSGLALAAWGRRSGQDIHLVESLTGRRRRDVWNDFVAVFTKGAAPRPSSLLAELFPRSFNIRIGEEDTIGNHVAATEDMSLRAWLTEKIEAAPPVNAHDNETSPIETLIVALAEREVAISATERSAAEAEAQAAALRSELAQAKSGRDAADAAAAELRTALDERDAAWRRANAQTAELRGTLDERVAALQRAQRQISEQEATIATLKREAEKRREELAAARRVERSLLTALRMDSVQLPPTIG